MYLEDYCKHVQCASVRLEPTGVAQEGGLFSSSYVSFLPHRPPAVLAFIFIARRVRPSLSLVDTRVEFFVYSTRYLVCD